MQYGFLIDHRRCIGCHACTVACKSENDVPVGSFRTWVKYTESGTFPSVKRDFSVLRCNQCSNAPCVTICPVTALDKRGDGIVDIDRDACIGCRACMQACPYDAIYLNEDSGAVEKCHFCAHRVEQNLAPACAVVCPEEAIIFGDLDDSTSRIAGMVQDHDTEVRRPEQNTGPNVHYLGHEPITLQPGAAERPPTYLWSDRPEAKSDPWPDSVPTIPDTRTVLDAGHRVEWGWPVALYLVTKGIAAGAAMLSPFASALGLTDGAERWLPEVLALVFVTITSALLIEDLARPKYFYRLLTRPNWNSWLVKGGIILGVFGASVSLTIVAQMMGMDGLVTGLRWFNAAVGLLVAGYTAWLFGQCEGRDLWQSKLLLPHLLVQATFCGAAAFLLFSGASVLGAAVLAFAGLGHLAFSVAEIKRPHDTSNARQAAGFLPVIRMGRLRPFRDGIVLVVLAIALGFLAPWMAWVPALVGLYLSEWAYVRAGQLPPLS